MALYYLGTFPPEYGGVTIKNQNLYTALSQKLKIEKVDFSEIKRKNLREAFKLVKVLINRKNTFVIGVAGKNTRKRFCKLLFYINKPSMERSIILLMGGTAARDIAEDGKYTKYVKEYKKIYVETKGMKTLLESVGVNHIGIYPNGRFAPKKSVKQNRMDGNEFRCVFFSLIDPQKGVKTIIEAAEMCKDVEFVFYGKIDPQYKVSFEEAVKSHKNIFYKGVYKGTADEVYSELGQYDVLLLPTTWKAEGVPGILIEAKISGLPAIVSNHNFNAEIITNGVDGIVMEKNSPECLAKNINYLKNNKELLESMRKNAFDSAEKYFIENYIEDIVKEIYG